VNGVVRPKKQKKNEKKAEEHKKDLTEPTLLEMPVYPGAPEIARHSLPIAFLGVGLLTAR